MRGMVIPKIGGRITEYKDVVISAKGQCPMVEYRSDYLIDDCDYYSVINCEKSVSIKLKFDGITVYGGYLRKIWGHFLVNSTARLWPIFSNKITNYDRIVFFAENDNECELKGNYREFFELAGIIDKVIVIPQTDCAFSDIIVGDVAFEMGVSYSAEFLNIFNFVREKAIAKRAAQ